jgi:glycosyltransferase involved in cell wall biosynthesis
MGTLPAPPVLAADLGDARPGTRYLLARSRAVAAERQLREAAQALEAWCLARLEPLASESTTRLLTTAAMPVSAAFLTPRNNVAALLAAAAQMQDERPDLDLVATGPWPPYHFVSN